VLKQGTGENWGGEANATKTAAPVTPNEQNKPIVDFVFYAQNWAEDIALVWAMGFEVNDDNKPAPENIPMNNEPLLRLGDGVHKGQEWGWDWINQQATLGGAMYNGPSFTGGWTPQQKSSLRSSSTSSPSNSS
jgi:hypothetical protein